MLTTISGLAATLGGLIVISFGVPSDRSLGHLLSFASGIMLYVSYGDLLPHASGGIGFYWANIWMFGGMLFFGLVVTLIPEPSVPVTAVTGSDPVSSTSRTSSQRMLMTGVIAAVGISLHNLPEGLVVYNATIGGVCREGSVDWSGGWLSGVGEVLSKCMGRGLVITWAIALHNIPEGMAVASPVYSATKDKWKTMKLCILSSVCEPLAALLFGTFFNGYLTFYFMSAMNAAVAGIMIMLCFVELIPASVELAPGKAIVLSNIIGQALMFFSLHKMYEAGVH